MRRFRGDVVGAPALLLLTSQFVAVLQAEARVARGVALSAMP